MVFFNRFYFTHSTYECKCRQGFTLAEDGLTCIDENECSLNNGHGPCQDICINTEGAYECACQTVAGASLAEDGHTCQSPEGCHNQNGGCSHQCIDSYSQVFCLCPEGYSLASDWKTCQARCRKIYEIRRKISWFRTNIFWSGIPWPRDHKNTNIKIFHVYPGKKKLRWK